MDFFIQLQNSVNGCQRKKYQQKSALFVTCRQRLKNDFKMTCKKSTQKNLQNYMENTSFGSWLLLCSHKKTLLLLEGAYIRVMAVTPGTAVAGMIFPWWRALLGVILSSGYGMYS